jgi:hypothetical protein
MRPCAPSAYRGLLYDPPPSVPRSVSGLPQEILEQQLIKAKNVQKGEVQEEAAGRHENVCWLGGMAPRHFRMEMGIFVGPTQRWSPGFLILIKTIITTMLTAADKRHLCLLHHEGLATNELSDAESEEKVNQGSPPVAPEALEVRLDRIERNRE